MSLKKYNHLKQFSFESLNTDQQKFILEYEIKLSNEQNKRKKLMEQQQKDAPEPKKPILNIPTATIKQWFDFYYKDLFKKDFIYTEQNKGVMNAIFMYFGRDPKFEDIHPDFKLSKGLGLIGGCGCGKTTLMQTFEKIGKDFYTKHQSLFFYFTLISCNMISMEYQADETKREITQYSKGLRCFDDLGSEKNVFGDKNLMEQILEQRYYELVTQRKGMNRTHFTTNLSKDDLKERYGDRVFDRLKETINFIPMKGESFRK